MLTTLVFDIETIPDIDGGRRLYGLEGLGDEAVAEAMFLIRREKIGSDFLPFHLHKIIAISIVLSTEKKLIIRSLGEKDNSEKNLIQQFFDGIEHYSPILVSWNGSAFDLPVLHHRALLNLVRATYYSETGENDSRFRYNNYLNRYHERHTDLMDVLSAYQGRGGVPLDEFSVLMGFPGKMGMSGDKVFEHYQKNDLASIQHYCETDVLNTYLIYLHYQLFRGKISLSELEHEKERLYTALESSEKQHLLDFLSRVK